MCSMQRLVAGLQIVCPWAAIDQKPGLECKSQSMMFNDGDGAGLGWYRACLAWAGPVGPTQHIKDQGEKCPFFRKIKFQHIK